MIPYPSPSAMQQDEFLTSGVITRRIAAWCVDAVLIGLLVSAFWTMGMIFGVLTLGLGFPLLGGLPALPVLYTWLTVTTLGATPGQALFGLAVRRDADLGPPDAGHAAIYALGYYLTVLLGAIWLAVALLTVRHRALHDLAAGVVVVRERALTPPPGSWNMGGDAWTRR